MITCYVRYVIDPDRIGAFETHARAWIPIVTSMGGTHHGYFLPREGDDVAVALFSFPSSAALERYRRERKHDPRCKAAFQLADSSQCIRNYEVRLMRPLLPEAS
jgi:hypothetical protein